MGFTKEQALMAIDREKELLTTASDQIWDNPETAFQEFKSTEILCELLEKEGFDLASGRCIGRHSHTVGSRPDTIRGADIQR